MKSWFALCLFVGTVASTQAQRALITVSGKVTYVVSPRSRRPATDATVYLLTGSALETWNSCWGQAPENPDMDRTTIECVKKANTPYITNTTPQGTYTFPGVSVDTTQTTVGYVVAIAGAAEGGKRAASHTLDNDSSAFNAVEIPPQAMNLSIDLD